jgi:energy-coupling factor transporter transmembrane protein EcfT
MGSDYFSLEVNKSNKLTRIFQLVFGIICAVVALIWLISNIKSLKSNGTLVITIIFLLGFAYYQINSGIGRGEKFIEISQSTIRLKKNSIFPAQELSAPGIEKIEIFPLNIVFFQRSGKTVFMRFGTTYTDIINPVRTRIKTFCEGNNIPLEFKNEEL